MTINDVLTKLENASDDTEFSKDVFDNYEEGKQDLDLKTGRRDWLIIADIYNKGQYTQKFHLKNYLDFKLKDGLCLEDDFRKKCYSYFNNAALIFYTREIVFEDKKETLESEYKKAKEYYNQNGKINNRSFAARIKY